MNSRRLSLTVFLLLSVASNARSAEIIDIWPGVPPGVRRDVGPEKDRTNADSRPVAGRRIVRLANVATAQIHVYLPAAERRNSSAMVICPGGGFNILAWDLEGTEVAEWLNTLGITGIVVKYRVPTRKLDPNWLLPVQDAQRAISIVRHRAAEWKLDPDRIGILGFSAGGEAAARTATTVERKYDKVDDLDDASHRPDLAVLVYPDGLINEEKTALLGDVKVTKETPPIFMVHAFDDFVPLQNCLHLMAALKEVGVASELHVYDAGGHGYGLRRQDGLPVTTWTHRCEEWLRRNRWANGQ